MSVDDMPDTKARSIVYDAMEVCHARRREYWMGRMTDSVSRHTLLRFQQSIIDYHDELRRYRSDVKDAWKSGLEGTRWHDTDINGQTGLDILPDIVDRVEHTERRVTQGGMSQIKTDTKPVVLPGRDLRTISYNLDDVAEKIGFATETKTPVAGLDEAEV